MKHSEVWEKAVRDLERILSVLEVKQGELTEEIASIRNNKNRLKEDMSNGDTSDRMQLQNDFQLLDRRLTCMQETIEVYREKSSTPYFTRVLSSLGTQNKEYFISKFISDPKNNLILFTAPLAVLRYRDIGDTCSIRDNKHNIIEKQETTIDQKELIGLNHFDQTKALVFREGQCNELSNKDIKKDIEVTKKNITQLTSQHTMPQLKETEKKKYYLGEIIAKMRKEQDEIMRAPYRGVTLIKGAAGSGKTNIAFHRIVYLTNEHPDLFQQENIAVFCFNLALQKYLSNMLKELSIPKVKVYSLDRWFYDILKSITNIGYLEYKEDEKTKILKTRMDILPVLISFYEEKQNELKKIVKIDSANKQSAERIDAYRILNMLYAYPRFNNHIHVNYFINKERYGKEAKVDASDQYLLTWLIHRISIEKKINIYNKYDHIVVDEVQDVMPIQMALLNGFHKNSMTLVGDVTQKIFSSGVDRWDQFNLTIQRIHELQMCHRSTLQTIGFANEILHPEEDTTLSTKVARQGKKPILFKEKDIFSANSRAVRLIREIKSQEPESSIAVVNYKNNYLPDIYDLVVNNGIDSYIASKKDWEFSPRVAITTYHQVKGLEFDYMIILGLNEYDQRGFSNKEQVIYTVVTRAQKQVFIPLIKDIPHMLKKIDPLWYDISDE